MDTFKFRLQKLLDIRIDMEEESKIKFRDAQIQMEKTEDKLKNLRHNYEEVNKKNSSSLIERKIKLNYLSAVNNAINDTKIELSENVRNLEEKRIELAQKQVERKTVETLKDKKERAFIREMDMLEQKTNDEFALYGFVRRRNDH